MNNTPEKSTDPTWTLIVQEINSSERRTQARLSFGLELALWGLALVVGVSVGVVMLEVML